MESIELFKRYKGNPILTVDNLPYPAVDVLNPAAVHYDEKTVLLLRVVDRRNYSHLIRASSSDGRGGWTLDSQPTLKAEPDNNEFIKGLEDPRVVWVPKLDMFVITCVSFRANYESKPYGISLITTKDFSSFLRVSQPVLPDNKNPALFPETTTNGHFALIHRPIVGGKSYIQVSFSPNLVFWGQEKPLISVRPWSWDSETVGIGPPPIKTEKGWLLIYHGSWDKAGKLIYRVGLALLDLETYHVIRRSEEWVFGPQEGYEGGNDGIIFPCGAILNEEGNIDVYYGTNDSAVGLVTAKLSDVLNYLDECPAQ